MDVLVCLESPTAAAAVLDYFLLHGLNGECAEGTDHAQRLLRFRRYDAFVCDAAFGAPFDEERSALARKAKRIGRGARTIVLTTSLSAEAAQSAGAGEIDILLLKPLPLDEILRSVRGERTVTGDRLPVTEAVQRLEHAASITGHRSPATLQITPRSTSR